VGGGGRARPGPPDLARAGPHRPARARRLRRRAVGVVRVRGPAVPAGAALLRRPPPRLGPRRRLRARRTDPRAPRGAAPGHADRGVGPVLRPPRAGRRGQDGHEVGIVSKRNGAPGMVPSISNFQFQILYSYFIYPPSPPPLPLLTG